MKKAIVFLISILLCTLCVFATAADCDLTGEHDLIISESVANTCTESGSLKWLCLSCGYTYTETIPPHGHDFFNGSCKFCHIDEAGMDDPSPVPTELFTESPVNVSTVEPADEPSPEPTVETAAEPDPTVGHTAEPIVESAATPTPEPTPKQTEPPADTPSPIPSLAQTDTPPAAPSGTPAELPSSTHVPFLPEETTDLSTGKAVIETAQPDSHPATPVPDIPAEPDATETLKATTPVPDPDTTDSPASVPVIVPEETNIPHDPGAATDIPVQASPDVMKNDGSSAAKAPDPVLLQEEPVYALELSLKLPFSNDLILLIVEKTETEVSVSAGNQFFSAQFWLIPELQTPEMILSGKCSFDSALHREKSTDDTMRVSLLSVDIPTLMISSDNLSLVFIPDDPSDITTIAEYFGISGSVLFSSGTEVSGTFYAD